MDEFAGGRDPPLTRSPRRSRARRRTAAVHATFARESAVRAGLRTALEADGMTGHALEAAMRDADAVLSLGQRLRAREGGRNESTAETRAREAHEARHRRRHGRRGHVAARVAALSRGPGDCLREGGCEHYEPPQAGARTPIGALPSSAPSSTRSTTRSGCPVTAARTRAPRSRAAATRALEGRPRRRRPREAAHRARRQAAASQRARTRPEHCDHVPLAEMARRLAG